MYRIIAVPILCATLALSGCSFFTSADKAALVSSDVAAVEVALTTAETLALMYTKLPRCAPIVPGTELGFGTVLCSKQAVVDKIKSLDMTAYNAVHLAMDNKGTVSAALTAIAVFSTAIPK